MTRRERELTKEALDAHRFAKATHLLFSLTSFLLRNRMNQHEELEALRREITELKIELARQSIKCRRRIKLFRVIDFMIQAVTALLISTSCWIFAFGYF